VGDASSGRTGPRVATLNLWQPTPKDAAIGPSIYLRNATRKSSQASLFGDLKDKQHDHTCLS
jgi:hypothetical protein